MGHDLKASGAGWMCSCGVWGWTSIDAYKHLKEIETSPIEKSVDEAWERNNGHRVGRESNVKE